MLGIKPASDLQNIKFKSKSLYRNVESLFGIHHFLHKLPLWYNGSSESNPLNWYKAYKRKVFHRWGHFWSPLVTLKVRCHGHFVFYFSYISLSHLGIQLHDSLLNPGVGFQDVAFSLYHISWNPIHWLKKFKYLYFFQSSFKGKKIHTLVLVDNPLETIDPEAFEGLVGTEVLKLARSKLSAINSEGETVNRKNVCKCKLIDYFILLISDTYFLHPFRYLE